MYNTNFNNIILLFKNETLTLHCTLLRKCYEDIYYIIQRYIVISHNKNEFL